MLLRVAQDLLVLRQSFFQFTIETRQLMDGILLSFRGFLDVRLESQLDIQENDFGQGDADGQLLGWLVAKLLKDQRPQERQVEGIRSQVSFGGQPQTRMDLSDPPSLFLIGPVIGTRHQ